MPMEQALRDFFSKEKDVTLAILMGSFAKGTARKDSDVEENILRGRLYACAKPGPTFEK